VAELKKLPRIRNFNTKNLYTLVKLEAFVSMLILLRIHLQVSYSPQPFHCFVLFFSKNYIEVCELSFFFEIPKKVFFFASWIFGRMEEDKKKLLKMKRLATGLLLVMALIFFVTSGFLWLHPVVGYIRAFAEAGMVGALADWFAVVALFKHPLGLPIPHTNLIRKNQASIGRGLGRFITDNFLSKETLNEKLEKWHFVEDSLKWLKEKENAMFVTKQITQFLPELVYSIDEEEMNQILKKQVHDFLNNIDIAYLGSEILNYVVAKDEHQKFLLKIIQQLSEYLKDPQNLKWIYTKVRDKSPKIIPTSIDDMYTKAFIEAIIEWIENIKKDSKHPIREEFQRVSLELIFKLKNSEELKNKSELLKQDFIQNAIVQNYTSRIWTFIKDLIMKDLTSKESVLKMHIHQSIIAFANRTLEDEDNVKRIENWLKEKIISVIQLNKQWFADYISHTVANWNEDVSEKIELQVGRDLQYIRINGTLVGGTVGLLIHIAEKVFHI